VSTVAKLPEVDALLDEATPEVALLPVVPPEVERPPEPVVVKLVAEVAALPLLAPVLVVTRLDAVPLLADALAVKLGVEVVELRRSMEPLVAAPPAALQAAHRVRSAAPIAEPLPTLLL
jgi:hypothetical protein